MRLPQDAIAVQQIITEYLNDLFDSNGEFRQNLTQGEDYILNAALNLLKAQQEMSNVLIAAEPIGKTDLVLQQLSGGTDASEPTKLGFFNQSVEAKSVLIGSGAGALAGQIIFGGWGAVFGAIAGTAITVYLASRTSQRMNPKTVEQNPESQESPNIGETIDSNHFCMIIGSICDSVDNLIATFRSQINRVVSKYEDQGKPALEKEFRFLLESVQSLVGYSRTHAGDEKFVNKVRTRIDDVAESLENYNLQVVDFKEGENDQWFDKIAGEETKEVRMVYPAIIKDGQVVLLGKVFVPQNQY